MVYVVVTGIDSFRSWICGVWATKELADKFVSNYKQDNPEAYMEVQECFVRNK